MNVPADSEGCRARPASAHHPCEVNEQLALVAVEPFRSAIAGGDGAAGAAGEPRPLGPSREDEPIVGSSNAREQPSLARLLLTPEEAAKLLAVGRTTLYGLLQSGKLTSVRIGASRRIPYDAVRAFVEGLTPAEQTVTGRHP